MKISLSINFFLLTVTTVLVTSKRIKIDEIRKYRKDYFQPRTVFPEGNCGYDGCPKPDPNMLNVHLVPHTHDDVGWLKTVDQYYYGSKTLIQKAGVQYILDSVVQELLKDPQKRFIYVESAFFFKWWREQDDKLKEQVQQLVSEGRLEFIGGAWSMNDEATTHYQSTVDQFTWGLRRLNDTFGECGRPRVGWQIDPFGHSREMASMFAQMGYDGMFFGRLDYQDKSKRLVEKSAEMIWHASANLGEAADLFTGVLYNNYGPPPGFCFDILCSDEPFIDNKHSKDYNVDEKIKAFFTYVTEMSTKYRTNNVIVTMGEDFNYQDANMWYKNLDKLISYGNAEQKNGKNINLFYSTPSCYLKALHEANITWPTKSDDFFPYASDPNAFWTGYFTSRPTLKRYERVGNHFLQVCKQLTAMAPYKESHMDPHLTFLRETMGIMQHHDAVTGTEKTHVADDYALRLYIGLAACSANTKIILNQFTTEEKCFNETKEDNLMTRDGKSSFDYFQQHFEPKNYTFNFESCHLLNISHCPITETSEKFVVTLYNPLSHSTYQYVRVPVVDENYQVTDYRSVPVISQIVPVSNAVESLQFRQSAAQYELVFLGIELPPLGYKSYFISKTSNETTEIKEFEKEPEVIHIQRDDPQLSSIRNNPINEIVTIGNKYLTLTFDTNGILSQITTDGITKNLTQHFWFYEGAVGDNKEFKNRSSGAYIFRPNNTEQLLSQRAILKVIKGPLVEEVHQVFNEWISQVVRVYREEQFVEFEWLVGPIPVEDKIGKEIITRFNTDIASNRVFYTDSNGRETIKRVRSHRETWDIDLIEKVAGNYYPVTTSIALEDDQTRMAILTDRAQGGSSLKDGSLELMIHRRLLHDDAFGVDEALNETQFGQGLVVRGSHYLLFGSQKTANPSLKARERFTQLKKLLPSWPFFSDASQFTYEEWRSQYRHITSGMTLSLPQNIHLMTLEPWKENSYLIRFEHILEKDDDKEYSKPVTFNLKDIFVNKFPIESIQETTLSGNQWIDDVKRFTFKPDSTKIIKNDEKRNEIIKLERRSIEIAEEVETVKRLSILDINPIEKEEINAKLPDDSTKYDITLGPMQIRTFIMNVDYRP